MVGSTTAIVVGTSVSVVVGITDVVGDSVVVVATVVVVVWGVVVVVAMVVVGFAVHWAYTVKSAVWLCAASEVISVPPDAAVNQPANVYPSRVGSLGSTSMVPPLVVVASPSDTAEPPWLSYVMFRVVTIEYTLTWPALLPAAPMATIDPSDDNETETPDESYAASPSISVPNWVHAVPFHPWMRT